MLLAALRIQDCWFDSIVPAGSGHEIAWGQLSWAALGTFGASACANTLNQMYEVANDGKMKRTMMRPLPLKRVTQLQALAFAAVMGIGGTVILAEKVHQAESLSRASLIFDPSSSNMFLFQALSQG